ncbi:hypothetical protein TomMM35A_20110 [Sphingobium sp. TomMM35A]
MSNERTTEDIVRDHFKKDPLFPAIKFDEQRASTAKAKACLKTASKNKSGKIGFPEFVISFPALPDDILVVECKADISKHQSELKDKPVEYAVDGALHYSGCLSTEFNVISIAVSGTDISSLKVSSFFQRKGEEHVSEIDSKLLDIYSYLVKFRDDITASNIESGEITKTAISLNYELNDYSIVEYERCTIVSAILLALQNESFKKAYKASARSAKLEPTPERITNLILTSIKDVLIDNKIDSQRIDAMMGEYKRIEAQPIAKAALIKKKKASSEEANYVLRDIAEKLEKSILPLITMGDKGYDVLGRFYREFIRYAGTDKKSGLVLTPQHITELFCDLVDLNVDDVVLDSCCGTGGFLIASMKRMLGLAGGDQKKRAHIKECQLVGVEKRTDMFTFACSNMMMSGDGKSHIYQGDSFSPASLNMIRRLKPTVSFLNPPYDVGEDGQLEFIENALSCLEPGGRCAAIVQMSCVTSSGSSAKIVRERLLKKHTLLGVLSMPDDLFHPVGVITCVVLMRAHAPHPVSFKPYFGFYKDDGFVKTKKLGRIDAGNWNSIRDNWIDSYTNRTSAPGFSILNKVTASDEWCAEAYMETDYSTLTAADFEKTLRDYIAFQVANG